MLLRHGELSALEPGPRRLLHALHQLAAARSEVRRSIPHAMQWGRPIMQRLALKLASELGDGARIVTVGQRLPPFVDLGEKRGGVRFDEIASTIEQLAWGRETFTCHRVARVGELVARRHRKACRRST